MRSTFLKSRAFTLVETLIYIGIFGVFFITAVEFSLTVQQNNLRASYYKLIGNNIIYLSNHLDDSFKNSIIVNPTLSIFSNPSGKIRLENGLNYYEYSLLNDQINFNKNGSNFLLIYDDVKVTSFYVEQVLNNNSIIVGTRITINFESIKDSNVKSNMINMYYLR